MCRYSIYLFQWYKSTKTDAEGITEVRRVSDRELKERVNVVFKPRDFMQVFKENEFKEQDKVTFKVHHRQFEPTKTRQEYEACA